MLPLRYHFTQLPVYDYRPQVLELIFVDFNDDDVGAVAEDERVTVTAEVLQVIALFWATINAVVVVVVN